MAALVGIVGTFAVADNTESSLQTITLDGVSSADLAKNGLTLAAPPAEYAPVIAEPEAAAAVAKYNGDARVKQLVLARVLNEIAVPKTDRVLWVANLDVEGRMMPSHGGPGTVPFRPYVYSLIFIDPQTGVVLGEVSLGSPIARQ